MFSQFRNAVEHLAQQQQSPPPNRRPASNSVSSEQSRTHVHHTDAQHSRTTGSLDETRHSLNQTTPSQLAESALLNFRKTFASSRPSSLGPSPMPDTDGSRQARPLEERLRASFTVGELSGQTTPNASKVPTPGEVDPASIALPLSPGLEPPASSLEEAFDPLGVQLSPTPSQGFRLTPPTVSETEYLSVGVSLKDVTSATNTPEVTSSPSQSTAPPLSDSLLQMASLQPPPLDSVTVVDPPGLALNEIVSDGAALAEPVPKRPSASLSAPHADSRPSTPRPLSPQIEDKEHDVEKLRERLKLVEQRFSGEFSISYHAYIVGDVDQMFPPLSSACKPKSVLQITF